MKVNEGMVADYHLASKRSERAAILASGGTGALLVGVIIWWPFQTLELFLMAAIFILTVAFAITGRDYKRKAEQIEQAWKDAYHLPG